MKASGDSSSSEGLGSSELDEKRRRKEDKVRTKRRGLRARTWDEKKSRGGLWEEGRDAYLLSDVHESGHLSLDGRKEKESEQSVQVLE